MKCIGHERVIDALSNQYDEGRMEISVVHGPYQVGKTYIAIELEKRHDAVYMMGRMANETTHVEALSKALNLPRDAFSSLEEAFTCVFEESLKRRMMLIIDDYPALVDAVPQAPILLRDMMSRYGEYGQLFIVVIGTSVDQLKGRIIGEASLIAPFVRNYHEVAPLTVDDVRALPWHFSDDESTIIHRITNGMPSYLAHIDARLSLEDNVIELFFKPTGVLFSEPQRILGRDIRNLSAANAILSSLAKMDKPFYMELSNASEIKSGTFATRLGDLMEMHIVGRVQGGSRGPLKYSDYHFTNTMFEFWYTYVFPNLEDIYRGKGAQVYKGAVKSYFIKK